MKVNGLRPNEKTKVVRHYDFLSPYYQSLWGEHLHHGYWIHGDESRETAQIQLIKHLANLAEIKSGSRVLDIGCGLGGSSFFLAEHYGAGITGITISAVQLDMANYAAAKRTLDARFLLMDAEVLQFSEPFDLFWSIESISHFQDPAGFFRSATKYLKPGGTFALTDFFRKKGLSGAETKRFIEPIEKSMFVELREFDDYAEFLTASGLRVTHREILNSHCAKTWDIALDILRKKAFWELAAKHSRKFVDYLRAFQVMRAGYASGNFVYGLFVAKLPLDND
jgi:tocopherol O-methyltransferase